MLQSKAYTEAFYLISQMSDEMKNRIPEKVLNNIKSRMDKNYIFNADNNDFEGTELLEDTEKILSVIYTDYFSTEQEYEVIKNKERILEREKVFEKQSKIPKLKLISMFGYKD